jgi:hypothetical protein
MKAPPQKWRGPGKAARLREETSMKVAVFSWSGRREVGVRVLSVDSTEATLPAPRKRAGEIGVPTLAENKLVR